MSFRGRGDRGRGGPSNRGTSGGFGQRGGGSGGGGAGDRGRGRGRGFGGSDRGRGGGGGPPRGGRGRGGNTGIWQENVRAIHSPQLKEEEDRIVAKFNAEKDDSPKLPLRTFISLDPHALFHRFVLKVPVGARKVKLASCEPTFSRSACRKTQSMTTRSR
jgi:hypothetical protein